MIFLSFMIEQMHFQDSELVYIYIPEALVQTVNNKDPCTAQTLVKESIYRTQIQRVNQNQKRVGPQSELFTEPSCKIHR